MNDIQQRLIDCFLAVFPVLTEASAPSASVESVDGWDSVAAVSLAAVIEEEFGVEVGPEDLGQMTSFANIIRWLRRKTGSS
jgi:acyl carrier protein